MARPITFSAALERSTNRLWGSHLAVPDTVADKLVRGGSRRVLCSLNGSGERQCALVPYTKGRFVITVNTTLRKALALDFGQSVEVRLRPDRSRYGLPVPEELEEVLQQDSEGRRLFEALTPGRRRTLLYMVGSAKTPDIRIRKSIVILTHLKTNGGKIDYRRLGQLLKHR